MGKKRKNSAVKKRMRTKVGLSPGSLIYVGEEYEGDTVIHLTSYNPDKVTTVLINSVDEIKNRIDPQIVNWVNITGIHNTNTIDQVGKIFGIHPLVMEDILNTGQRPKLEVYDTYLFASMKIVYRDTADQTVPLVDQISFVLGDHYLLSFQEIDRDYFQPIRQRIDRDESRIRSMKTDYLLFALIDLIVDQYLALVEHIGDDMEILEDKIFNQPEKEHL